MLRKLITQEPVQPLLVQALPRNQQWNPRRIRTEQFGTDLTHSIRQRNGHRRSAPGLRQHHLRARHKRQRRSLKQWKRLAIWMRFEQVRPHPHKGADQAAVTRKTKAERQGGRLGQFSQSSASRPVIPRAAVLSTSRSGSCVSSKGRPWCFSSEARALASFSRRLRRLRPDTDCQLCRADSQEANSKALGLVVCSQPRERSTRSGATRMHDQIGTGLKR